MRNKNTYIQGRSLNAIKMIIHTIMRPSQGFGGTGEQGHSFEGNRGTNAIFSGEQGNKQ